MCRAFDMYRDDTGLTFKYLNVFSRIENCEKWAGVCRNLVKNKDEQYNPSAPAPAASAGSPELGHKKIKELKKAIAKTSSDPLRRVLRPLLRHPLPPLRLRRPTGFRPPPGDSGGEFLVFHSDPSPTCFRLVSLAVPVYNSSGGFFFVVIKASQVPSSYSSLSGRSRVSVFTTMADNQSSSNLGSEEVPDPGKARSDRDTPPMEQAADREACSEAMGSGGIDSLFDRLEIGEEEFDDLILEEADVNLEESTRWLAVARVNCNKGYSHEAFFQQMRAAWNPAREISIRPVGANKFVIQCFCLGDWEKVMERGPWLFRDWTVILAPYDGISDPDLVVLEFMPVWIQIHKIPEAYRKKEVVTQLVSRQAGEVITVEMTPAGGFKGGRGAMYDSSGRGPPGRGTARGRGTYVDWRHHPERRINPEDMELSDTASSPIKPGEHHMSDAEKSAKKRLAFEQASPDDTGALALSNSVEDVNSENQGEEENHPVKDKKRHKKEDGTSVSGNSGSAASLEGDRRDQ
ncbi:hypothetical protein QYE76_067513 [Lolium multiflorum]|uniref:DUF4283 domain-containing protein n=1 Tax=Lolium multiflorum TaxID=4521 RepID=A0AAD8SEF7_LOLMU|nr:hypothetical protein QYE76_067513 [Lolium multiflorum]